MAQQKVSVLGLGNWGTALGQHLAVKGFDVLGWTIEPKQAEGINASRRNPFSLSQAELSPNFKSTTDLSEAQSRGFLVLAVPSSALGSVVPKLDLRHDPIVVSAIKGLESSTLLTPLQYLRSKHGEGRFAVLSGPSFAKDVAAGLPCGVVAAGANDELAMEIAKSFASASMRVYTSTDWLGVEIGGVVKNVIAIAAGVIDGMGLGDSARAGLITRGLAEMMRLAVAMGAKPLTLSGLAGLGDLIMTASCDQSRNRTVGLRLGRGEKLSEILRTLGSVAEGVESTPLVLKLAGKHAVEMPICTVVAALLAGQITTQELVNLVMSRPSKKEFEFLQ